MNNNFANRTTDQRHVGDDDGQQRGRDQGDRRAEPVGNSGGKSVWWTWTAPSSGSVQIDTIGSSFDTILGVYTGSSVSALTTVASDDDSGGNYTSKVTFNAVAGTTYQIAWTATTTSGGVGQHHAACQPHLGRYPGAERQHDLVDVARDHQGTAGATTSFTVSGSGLSANASVTVVAPSGCEISLSGSSGFANMLPLSASSGGTLSSTQIYSRISALAATNISGIISLNDSVDNCSKLLPVSGTVTPVTGPVNNNFANRTTDQRHVGDDDGQQRGRDQGERRAEHRGQQRRQVGLVDVDGPSSGSVQIDTIGSSFDTIMGVYTGSSVSSLTTRGQRRRQRRELTSKVTFNAVAGTTYQIAVDGYNYGRAASGNITLHVSLHDHL